MVVCDVTAFVGLGSGCVTRNVGVHDGARRLFRNYFESVHWNT